MPVLEYDGMDLLLLLHCSGSPTGSRGNVIKSAPQGLFGAPKTHVERSQLYELSGDFNHCNSIGDCRWNGWKMEMYGLKEVVGYSVVA